MAKEKSLAKRLFRLLRTPVLCDRLKVSTCCYGSNKVACSLREVYTDAQKLDKIDFFSAGAHFEFKTRSTAQWHSLRDCIGSNWIEDAAACALRGTLAFNESRQVKERQLELGLRKKR